MFYAMYFTALQNCIKKLYNRAYVLMVNGLLGNLIVHQQYFKMCFTKVLAMDYDLGSNDKNRRYKQKQKAQKHKTKTFPKKQKYRIKQPPSQRLLLLYGGSY